MKVKSFNSYLSSRIYDDLVPKNDFFRALDSLFDWTELTFDLNFLANNDHGGRPRYQPVLLFKMLFLSFLYDISDRETADLCTNNIRCKFFLGLDITQPSPHYSMLSLFKKEIIEKFGFLWLTELFYQLVNKIKEQGLSFGKVQALDATHTIANVNTFKDNENKKNDKKPPRDTDASWGAKGTENKKTPKGETVKVVKYFYGYKSHILAETDFGIITGLAVSSGNVADINAGEDLVIRELIEKRNFKIDILTADKSYGCGVLIGILEKDKNVQTAFGLNGQFYKGKYKEHWKQYTDDPEHIEARKKRSVIERVNADLKNNHGLRRCRFLGLENYSFQATMAAIVYNIKRFIKIMVGIKFKPT
jgi:transposase